MLQWPIFRFIFSPLFDHYPDQDSLIGQMPNKHYFRTEEITKHRPYQVALGQPSQTTADCQWHDWQETLPRRAAKCRRVSSTLPVSLASVLCTGLVTACLSSRLS